MSPGVAQLKVLLAVDGEEGDEGEPADHACGEGASST